MRPLGDCASWGTRKSHRHDTRPGYGGGQGFVKSPLDGSNQPWCQAYEEPSEHGSLRLRATQASGSFPPGSQVIMR
jgi:hypothetical protein